MLDEFKNYPWFCKNKFYYIYERLATKIMIENRTYDSSIHESHHVLPKCFGGSMRLSYTYREHYIAHLLLCKFTISDDKHKMTFAMHSFFHFDTHRRLGLRHSSLIYEAYKKRYIKMCKEIFSGLGNPRADKKSYMFKELSSGRICKMTRTEFKTMNTKVSDYDLNAMIRAYKNKTKCSSKGWTLFVDDLNIFANEIPTVPKPQKLTKCNYCGLLTTGANHKRWHGDKCKSFR